MLPDFLQQRLKMMSGQSPAERVCLSIDQRVKRVSYFLPLAATHWRDDLEHVHQLRIATRQVLASLDTYRSLVDDHDWSWLRKRMKRIRSAAADARDLDVMLHRFKGTKVLGGKALRRFLRKRRRVAQRPLVKLNVRQNQCLKFEAYTERCFNAIEQASDCQVSMSSMERIEELAQSIVQTQPSDARDFETFHDLRVQAKQLRYTLELLSELGSTAYSTNLHPIICEVQQKLGQLNDHVMSSRRLSQLAQDVRSKKCVALLHRLSEKDDKKARKAGKSFLQWWTGERSTQVKTALAQCSLMFDSVQEEAQ